MKLGEQALIWEDIEAAVAAEAWSRALGLAVNAWRERRHPCFADLVDVLSTRANADLPKVPGDAFHATWLERARTGDDAVLGALLATLTRSLPQPPPDTYWRRGTTATRYASWLARVEALGGREADPRIAKALLDVVRKAPWATTWPEDVVTLVAPMLAIVTKTADERTIMTMRALLEKPIAKRAVVRQYLAEALPEVIAAIVEDFGRRALVDDAEIARCTALTRRVEGEKAEARAPTEDASALFELVVAEPDDDAARAVLADFWLERGDSRGAFVNLQLKPERTAADEKAIRALLREHEKDWIGDLALVTKNRVFERGFLAEIELQSNAVAEPKVWAAAALEPALGTVTRIRKGRANEDHYLRFVSSPLARSLRTLEVISKAMLEKVLARPAPWLVECLAIDLVVDAKLAARIGATTVFPALEQVNLGVKEGGLEKLIGAAKSLGEVRPVSCIGATPLRWMGSLAPLVPWLAAIATGKGNEGPLAAFPAVELILGPKLRLRVERGRKGLHATLDADRMYYAYELLGRLRKLCDVERLTLAGTPIEGQDRKLFSVLDGLAVEANPAWDAVVRANR